MLALVVWMSAQVVFPIATSADSPPPPKLPQGATVFRPVPSCRLADSRLAAMPDTVTRFAPTAVRVNAGDRCGVPPDAVAIAITLTVTVTASSGAGFAVAWPAGEPMPAASTVNITSGDTRSSAAIVRLGASAAIDVLTSVTANVIVDVSGAFVPAAAGATAGRFVAITPRRVLDTRDAAAVEPRTSVAIGLPAGIPTDVVALAINITGTANAFAGYMTVHPVGGPVPVASVMTTAAPGETRAAATIVAVTPAGFAVFMSSGGHLVVDVSGYFTGPSAEPAATGLYVPMSPARLVDTRGYPPLIHPGGTIEMSIDTALAGLGEITSVGAIAGTWTMVAAQSAGYITAYAAGTERPPTSTANTTARRETVANFGIVGLSNRGTAAYSSVGTDLVVDISGWFTGPPVVATLPPADNTKPVLHPVDNRLAYIGDSLTFNDQGAGLKAALSTLGWAARIDGRPSRNMVITTVPSGITAIRTMRAAGFDPTQWVIALGTNDIDKRCPTGTTWDKSTCFRGWIAALLAEIGDDRDVLWVNVYRADEPAYVKATDDFERVLREFETAGALRVIDFLSWARSHPADFRDRIHLFTVPLMQIRIGLITAAITDFYGTP